MVGGVDCNLHSQSRAKDGVSSDNSQTVTFDMDGQSSREEIRKLPNEAPAYVENIEDPESDRITISSLD